MFQIKVVVKIETHVLCSVTFSENRAFCEVISKHLVETEMPQKTIWHMRVACWISKATGSKHTTSPVLQHPHTHHARV